MLIKSSCADKEYLIEEGAQINPWETPNMKYSRDDVLPPAARNDLSASYGLNRLKGSNCDINPFSRLSSRMTWSAVSTASPRSKRIQTEQSQAQTATRGAQGKSSVCRGTFQNPI